MGNKRKYDPAAHSIFDFHNGRAQAFAVLAALDAPKKSLIVRMEVAHVLLRRLNMSSTAMWTLVDDHVKRLRLGSLAAVAYDVPTSLKSTPETFSTCYSLRSGKPSIHGDIWVVGPDRFEL